MKKSRLGYGRYWTNPMPENELQQLESSGDIQTIPDLLKFLNKNYANLVAITSKNFSKTYFDMLNDVAKMQSFLIAKEIKFGDIVGLHMKNEYAFITMFLAITSMGAISMVFPLSMPGILIANLIEKHHVRLLIYSDSLDKIYSSWNNKTQVINTAKIENKGKEKNSTVKLTKNTIAALYFTGGTIGKPKIVTLTHRNLTRGMVNGAYGFPKILHLNYLTVIPFFHIFGLVRSLLTPLYTGSNNYICDEPKNFIHNFSIAHPDITCITPSLLEVICFFGEQNKQLLGGKLKFIVCGGAHIPQSLLIRAAKLGIYASSGYGSTETTNLVSGNRFSLKRPHSVGYLFPHQKIKIVNGELWIKGDNVSPGYFFDKVNTNLAFDKGWFKTGDLVEYKNKNLYIIGRNTNTIVLPSGEKIFPEEIEAIFNDYSLIKDSLIYYEKGELILEVYPYMNQNSNTKNVNDLIKDYYEKTNRTLPMFMRINKLIIRTTDFKRSPVMKILRNQQ